MKLILLTHPASMQSTSMPRFANFIAEGMRRRGHSVSCWTSSEVFGHRRIPSRFAQKWLGYVDRYLIFPRQLKTRLKSVPRDTLIVMADHALSMWLPHVQHRPHVIHCHDFLAMRSANGDFAEHSTAWVGRRHLEMARRGLMQGRNFICVSHATQRDLHRFLDGSRLTSEVISNGLHREFRRLTDKEAAAQLAGYLQAADCEGFLLHVGGNQWYKNREGVVRIYRSWCELTNKVVPLWMVGSPPTPALKRMSAFMPRGGQVRFLSGLNDDELQAAYSLAKLLLFPSLEEGFGWPIAEALACGTAVLTTDLAPMTEVGGKVASYQPRLRVGDEGSWARSAAAQVDSLLGCNPGEQRRRSKLGQEYAERFAPQHALDGYERIYRDALSGRLSEKS